MATEMQPFINGLSMAGNHSVSDMRDRNAGVMPSASTNRFDTMLGKAEAGRTGPGHEPMQVRSKQAARPRASTASRSSSQTDRSARTAATARQERSATRNEGTRSPQAEDPDNGQDEQTTEMHDEATQSPAMSPEMMLAAGMAPQPRTGEEMGAQEAFPSKRGASAAEAPVEEVHSAVPAGLAAPAAQSTAATQSSTILPPGQLPGQEPVEAAPNGAEARSAGPAKAADIPAAESGTPEAAVLSQVQHQDTPLENVTSLNDGSTEGAPIEPDKGKLAATVISTHMPAKPTSGTDSINQADLQPLLDTIMQASDASAGQGASSAEQFFGQDTPSSSDSRNGPDHPKSNLLSSDNHSLRPQFLDQTSGIGPSAPPASDSRVGRIESGQAPIAHASESERISELRGAFSSAQTVTLDLDPLDMGPLRVRIMMTDQTVHAHIRTEHGELGQGLLQQGQSLEASLRTTGLEMGMLRVTVDQQQQGRGDNPWAFQPQQQGRPGLASGLASTPAEEERASRMDHGFHNNGHVSFFA